MNDTAVYTGAWYPTQTTGECVRTSLRHDVPFEQFECVYPTLGKTYFAWEYPGHGAIAVLDFMEENPWFPIVSVGLYALAIFWGQKYMADKPAWDWRKRLAAWNLFLAVFSAWGTFRMAPHLLHNIYHYDFETNVCTHGETMGGWSPTTYWGLFFVWSKFFELFDTFFIVVRKKKLMLLHWYHHITVLLCCWHTVVSRTPPGFIFATVNFFVHSIMYFYYFLMAIRCKPKWFKPKVITVVQILQMVVGVTVCARSFNLAEVNGCEVSKTNIKYTLMMYASYLYLFSAFFVHRYVKGGIKKAEKAKSA